MSEVLSLRNRQRVRRIEARFLRSVTMHLIRNELRIRSFELAIHFVGAREMASVNWRFLRHEGSTDVITFDHSDGSLRDGEIHGELFICVDDAVRQARAFKTNWQSELARYVVHGLLHLCGYDDLAPASRRRMKREENRLVQTLSRGFALKQIGRRGSTVAARDAVSGGKCSRR